jgi:hypothetical protein
MMMNSTCIYNSSQPDSVSVTQFDTNRIFATEQKSFNIVAIDRSRLADGSPLCFTIYKQTYIIFYKLPFLLRRHIEQKLYKY